MTGWEDAPEGILERKHAVRVPSPRRSLAGYLACPGAIDRGAVDGSGISPDSRGS